jgi:cytochrome c556
MKMTGKLAGRLILVAMMATVGSARADDQDIIDYRKHIMITLREEVAILGMILEQRAPADGLVTHAQILAATAATTRLAFEQQIPGGESKPSVWANWDNFSKRLDELVATTADLAKSAQDGGATAVATKIKALNCESCHDTYRVPK